MTPLAEELARRIAQTGPISISEFMSECLLNPRYGYYATRDPLGRAGDFTTAPEISQMFGECLGLCLAQTWLDQGAPGRLVLAELGPGRGTLMADALRATRGVPGFHDAVELHLVEASPVLRDKQAKCLGAYSPSWHASIATLPDGPLFLLANEFFDALPIRQFLRGADGWSERHVGLSEGRLAFGLSAPTDLSILAHRRHDTRPGDIVEVCPALGAIVSEIGTRIATFGGAALIVDYGDWRSLGDTLQAARGHAYDDPLAHPGEADLTAHVDFEAVARHASPALASPMVTQGELLERLGITDRARRLATRLSGDALDNHVAAHRRLTHPEEMGRVFKAIALHPIGQRPPPGFE